MIDFFYLFNILSEFGILFLNLLFYFLAPGDVTVMPYIFNRSVSGIHRYIIPFEDPSVLQRQLFIKNRHSRGEDLIDSFDEPLVVLKNQFPLVRRFLAVCSCQSFSRSIDAKKLAEFLIYLKYFSIRRFNWSFSFLSASYVGVSDFIFINFFLANHSF